jgi:hypothetical protein
LWRSACDLVNALAVGTAWAAMCLVVSLVLWRPDVVRAAPVDGCIAGLPADLATHLQPLIQALCESSQSGASGLDPPSVDAPSQHQQDLESIAQAMALLAMADPGYGYAPSNCGIAPLPGSIALLMALIHGEPPPLMPEPVDPMRFERAKGRA